MRVLQILQDTLKSEVCSLPHRYGEKAEESEREMQKKRAYM